MACPNPDCNGGTVTTSTERSQERWSPVLQRTVIETVDVIGQALCPVCHGSGDDSGDE